MQTIFKELGKFTNPFNSFLKWFRKTYPMLTDKFLLQPFDVQLGVILRYLEEVEGIAILADNANYTVYYINDELANKYYKTHHTIYILQEYNGSSRTTLTVYYDVIIKIFNKLQNPF